VISKEALLQLAQKLGARGGFLVVDEAFADAHEAVTIAANAEDAPMIVLKSFGKFFGLAGVRLGFAITGGRFVEALERRLGPWAVSGPALAIANHAFSDAGTLADYRTRIDLRRAGLSAVLDKSGLREIGGTALFSLVEHVGAIGIYTRLCERHILIRKFDFAPRWLRIGLPLDDVALARFEKALKF